MIDLNDFTAQAQMAHWGWTIAFFLWFVGLSGMGMFLNNWVREKALVYVCTFAGIAGTLLVVSHLTRMLNLPMAAFSALMDMSFNWGSWMFIGICLLVLQCCLTLFYSLVLAGVLFKGEGLRRLVAGNAFNRLLAVLGVAATIYSGFLLTQAVGVTLWNTALIPLLWIMSGMASSIGCIELLMVTGKLPKEKVFWNRRTALWVETAELFTIFAFVHVAVTSASSAARAGAESLLAGPQSLMFWVGVVILGSIVPLTINLSTRSHKGLAVSAVLGILGALLLRACVLFAGYYEPTLL